MASECVIGVDLGGTKLLAGVVDGSLEVHHRAFRQSRVDDAAEVLDLVSGAINELMTAHNGEIAAVGFGIPSLVDFERGAAVTTTHLPLTDVPFRDLMSERLAVPVALDNDGNTAMIAEHRFGAAKGVDNAVLMTLGTGIASAILADGRLLRGATGAAAELGHMVIDLDGPMCTDNCPNQGCLEVLASGTALATEAQRIARQRPGSALGDALMSGRELTSALTVEMAHDGDPGAKEVVRTIGERLGVGIANVVNIFNPEVVIIGGGVIAAGDLLLEPARRVVSERALSPSKDTVKIVPTRFGAESGMLGAAAMALDLVS